MPPPALSEQAVPVDDSALDVGMRIRRRRLELRMTQAELAQRIGVIQTAISHYETGTYVPDLNRLYAIAEVLEVSVCTLLGEAPWWMPAGVDISGLNEESQRAILAIIKQLVKLHGLTDRSKTRTGTS